MEQEHDVYYAENGAEAVAQIRKNADTLSLVLLDLLMPVMDGYEALRIMQADPQLRRIPVIILTSEKDAEVETLQLGATDFIPKPYNMPDVILARIDRAIELNEDQRIIHAAEDDVLTGLYTRDFFFQYARLHDRYYPDMPMDAAVLNVNRFHLVNELYGRTLGNTLLRKIADALRRMLDEQLGGLAGRVESDTFYVYLPHREDNTDRLTVAVEEACRDVGHVKVTVRGGIYPSADPAVDMEQRFDRANLACARLRGHYATAFAVYDTQLHEKELYSERLIGDVETALAEKQFRVYYQAKYRVQEITELLRARKDADYSVLLQEIMTRKEELDALL